MDDKVKSRDQGGEHTRDRGANQGEGDYRSARNYDEHVRRTAESGQVDKKAREAEKAIAGKEGDELRRAEEMGKRHSHGEDPQLHQKKK
jgi:hypothetical protein